MGQSKQRGSREDRIAQAQHAQVTVHPVDAAIDQVVDLMNKPMELYSSARRVDELDLVAVVREKMVEVGLGDRIVECFDNNRFIQEAKNLPAHSQQYNLNRYFATQFMAAEKEAAIERYALIYEIRPDEWLHIFDKTILPAVVDYDLPVVL